MAKQDQQTSSKTLMRVDELPLIT
ncbi:transposase, partial [Rhodococcus opacus]